LSQNRRAHAAEAARPAGPLPTRDNKVAYVRSLFSRIAPRYDLMNRLMTLGFDLRWRRLAVRNLLAPSRDGAPSEGPRTINRVLDVATGTGDLAIELLRQNPALDVVGLDLVPEMLDVAGAKATALLGRAVGPGGSRGCLEFVEGDALRLPFADAEFDAVVTGFAMRNVLDIPSAFREMARVTRAGGRVACLELAKPRMPVFRRLFAFYFFRLVPLLGRILTGETAAYTYLPHSLSVFLTPDQIVEVMQSTGWRDVHYRRLMLGTVALHSGVRE